MYTMRTASISTWIATQVLRFVRSMPSSESLACAHCGLNIVAQRVDGTSSSTFAIRCFPRKRSHSNVVVAVTSAGKLSILCACSQLEELQSHHGSGVVAGTFFSPENSARSCGCDPGVAHFCSEYPECAYGQELRKGSVRDA
jgi:hypothetical protein